MTEVRIYPDHRRMSEAAAAIFSGLALSAVASRGVFTAALSGGSTPKPVYAALAESETMLPWEQIHLFWGDERHVPPDDPDSNYRMVRETLLSAVNIPAENIHRVRAEMDPRMAAFDYEDRLRAFFHAEWPVFDLVLLGMGSDGHTASLFPHSTGLNEGQRWFIANRAPELEAWRLTLTKNAINAARHILVLAAGESKAERVYQVLEGPQKPTDQPIQMIDPEDGDMTWLLDEAAAGGLIPSTKNPAL